MPFPDLRQRLLVLVWVRFLVVPAIVLGALFASRVVGIPELNVGGLCLLAAALLLCNTITYLAIHPRCGFKASRGAFLEGVLHFSVATDFVLLVVALWLVGGPFSPFKAFFIFNVIIASMLLSRRAAFLHALLAFTLLSALVIGTWRGWIPGNYPYGAVAAAPTLSAPYVVTVLVVQGLLIMFTALLTTHLMCALRNSAQRLYASKRKLETVSQLRRDFLQIALHNLRSPVGVVSMHLSNMANGYGGPLTAEQRSWLDRSQYRLRELTHFLHDLEYLAALETEGLEPHMEMVDLKPVVEDVFKEHRELAEAFEHQLSVQPGEGVFLVHGVRRLIREAITNYVTNAIKYTPRGGRIEIRVVPGAGGVRVEVEDNGIGVAAEDQKRLFRELVRIKRPDSKLGEVVGSGLGLHIVERVAEMHGGKTGVVSEEGKGSIFSITFPAVGFAAQSHASQAEARGQQAP